MPLAEATTEKTASHFGAVASRQLSVWPFGARTARLFLLVDPSVPDQGLRRGLLRAMQQAYFQSDGCSQTRAVREAALAAHYVLRDHNRDVLHVDQFSAASAVAALRNDVAFVALAGDAAAFAWREGVLTGQRGIVRLPRPLGLEQEPRITLWSTRLDPGDRLVLVCGAVWNRESRSAIEAVLSTEEDAGHPGMTEERLAEALGGPTAAAVLIVEATGDPRPQRHLALVSTDRGMPPQREPTDVISGRARRWLGSVGARVLSSVVALGVLGTVTVAALSPSAASPELPAANQARGLLAQAGQTPDSQQARALLSQARDLAHEAASTGPSEYSLLVNQADSLLDQVDRVYAVAPEMAVRLGPSGANVVDLAVGDNALYTLDVVESSVRAFALDSRDQHPTPETLVVRSGTPIGAGQRRLAAPVGIQYLSGPSAQPGVLAIVDQSRSVVQVGPDRGLSLQPVPSSASWGELGALGADLDGHLLVLDSGSEQLLQYPSFNQQPVDPPRRLLDGSSLPPGMALDRVAEVIGQQGELYVRTDDGGLRRFDASGAELPFQVRLPDGQPISISGMTADRAGGLYLADPAHARILQTSADGSVLRQLRDPALAGLRRIQSSSDERHMYGLVAAGVLVFDIPE